MNHIKKGHFFGAHKDVLDLEQIVITDTEYTHDKVDWHYHENAYFTYLIHGGLYEENKKEAYELKPGSLLFHNWQDAHYNIKPDIYTQGFHIELEHDWFKRFSLSEEKIEGSMKVENNVIKKQFDKVYLESKINDSSSAMAVDSLLLSIFSHMTSENQASIEKKPKWVKTINEMLNELSDEHLSLANLSKEGNITPIHLSREFRRYFGSTLGEYLRLIKVNKAAALLKNKSLTLSEITNRCNFSDQSHFIRCFKSQYKQTPQQYRKLILEC